MREEFCDASEGEVGTLWSVELGLRIAALRLEIPESRLTAS